MRTMEPISRLDLAFSLLCVQNKYSPALARVSKAISHTGDGHLYLVLAFIAYWFDESVGKFFVFAGLLAFAIELPIYWGAKNLFRRRRPEEFSHLITSYITPSDRYSLPSGHTAAAFLMAMLIAHFYPPLGEFVYLWAGLVALSRVFLGVHFLTDIVIGALLGSACAYVSLIVTGGL